MMVKINLGRENKTFLGIFNTRPLLIALIFMIFSISSAVFLTSISGVIFCSLALAALFLYKFNVLSYRTFCIVLICICLSLTSFAVLKYHSSVTVTVDSPVYLSGRVINSKPADNGFILTMDNIDISGAERKGKVLVYADKDLNIGDRVLCYGKLKTFVPEDLYSVRHVCYGEYYAFYPSSVEYKFPDEQPLREGLLDRIRYYFTQNSSEDVSAFSMSLLFGESDRLEELDAYRQVNLAHLFAVSGLHVGTLTAVLYFIFTKVFKRKKYALSTFAVTTVILGFYAYLCGFSPSVIRAFLSVILATILSFLRLRPDNLNVWALSAVISLIIRPLWLFDVSFILSYLAVLGIFLLYPLFKRVFKKGPKRLLDALALNLSVSLSVVPVSTYFFGSFSLVSLPLSLVFIPLISVTYVYLLICLPFLAFSVSKIMLLPAAGIVKASNAFVTAIASLQLSVNVNFAFIALPFWFIALFLISDYCLLPKIKRIFASICSVVASFVWISL